MGCVWVYRPTLLHPLARVTMCSDHLPMMVSGLVRSESVATLPSRSRIQPLHFRGFKPCSNDTTCSVPFASFGWSPAKGEWMIESILTSPLTSTSILQMTLTVSFLGRWWKLLGSFEVRITTVIINRPAKLLKVNHVFSPHHNNIWQSAIVLFWNA